MMLPTFWFFGKRDKVLPPAFAAFCPGIGADVPLIQDLAVILVCAIGVAFAVAGGVALIVIAFGGLKYIMSGGDEKALKSAKETLTWGIIGLFLILFSVVLIQVLGKLIGVENITNVVLPGP